MKKKIIALKPFNSNTFMKDRIFNLDNGHNIFWRIDRFLAKKNIEMHTIDLIDNAQKYMYADMPYPWNIKRWAQIFSLSSKKKILFCFESPLVNPFNHMRFLQIFFGTIFTWNDLDVKRGYKKFLIPQLTYKGKIKSIPFAKKKYLVLINAKKSIPFIFRLFSPFRTDLYRARKRFIQFAEVNYPQRFDLYGKGWDKADKLNFVERIVGVRQFRVYRGELPPLKKLETLAQYKYCICFENAVAPGYITEKIFDCFVSKCVPIYWGAPNVKKFIPKQAFIDMTKYTSYQKLMDFLQTISESQYNKYVSEGQKFLKSKTVQTEWYEQGFENVLIRSINIKHEE